MKNVRKIICNASAKRAVILVMLCTIVLSFIGCSNDYLCMAFDDNTIKDSSIEPISETPLVSRPTESVTERFEEPTQLETTTNTGVNNMDNNYKLVIKNREVTVDCYVKLNYEYHYAELPFITILNELGATIVWVNESLVNIMYNSNKYDLDIAKGTLIKQDGSFNIFSVAPGSMHGSYYKVVGKEFVIDSDSATAFIVQIMGAKLNIDFDNKTVVIN